MKIGENIREIREKEKELSKDEVAVALGITSKAYSNIEANISDITITRLCELAEIFKCSPEYILTYQQKTTGITNHFNNYSGNNGVNIMYQGCSSDEIKTLEESIKKSKQEITRVEAILKTHNN